MTDEEAFDDMVSRMNELDASGNVEITEVAEKCTLIEVVVPIRHFPQPEQTLLQTLAAYVASEERRAIVSMNVVYELRQDDQPYLIAALMLTDPL